MKKTLVLLLAFPLYSYAGLTDFKTIEEAKHAYEAKEYGESKTLLESLDTSPEQQYDLGNALYKDKKYEEAIEAYEKAQGVDEASRQHNLGNSHFQNKDLEKAIEAYEKSLALHDDVDTKKNLALAKEQKKKKDDKKKDDKKDKEDKEDKEDKKDDKKKKDEDKDKKDGDKKDDKKKEEEKKKQEEKKASESKEEKKESKEEKLKEQELKRLMKKMQEGKTPTMMYQMGEDKKGQRSDDVNPW